MSQEGGGAAANFHFLKTAPCRPIMTLDILIFLIIIMAYIVKAGQYE